jgi:hypothetical protein
MDAWLLSELERSAGLEVPLGFAADRLRRQMLSCEARVALVSVEGVPVLSEDDRLVREFLSVLASW